MSYGMETYLDTNRNTYKKSYTNTDTCLMHVVWKIDRYNSDLICSTIWIENQLLQWKINMDLPLHKKRLYEDKIGIMILIMQNRNNSTNFYKCYKISGQNELIY